MTIEKETARLLSRAERMRVAIADSGASRQWERADLEHMAEAATMLWEQAESLAKRSPSCAGPLSESLARIFEPLLAWDGRFRLACCLARSRRGAKAFAADPLDAEASLFEYLALRGKFEDAYPWQRVESFAQAQALHATLAPAWPTLSARAAARVAHGWHLMERPALAASVLQSCVDPAQAAAFYLRCDAPKFWRDAHLQRDWLAFLNAFLISHEQSSRGH